MESNLRKIAKSVILLTNNREEKACKKHRKLMQNNSFNMRED